MATAGSLIHEAMPRWGGVLGRPLVVRGADLPPGSTRQDYERFCADLAADPDALGAVVTSHKAALYDAVSQCFDELDEVSHLTGEINAIRRTGTILRGWARDPVSVGRVVDTIWPVADREAVCLGGGGTAVALLTHLARRSARPAQVTVCETSERRLDQLAGFLGRLGGDLPTRLVAGRPDSPWDLHVARPGPGTLVVSDRFAEAVADLAPARR